MNAEKSIMYRTGESRRRDKVVLQWAKLHREHHKE
jgi:hypothetical protein